jgi:hypothetical protein
MQAAGAVRVDLRAGASLIEAAWEFLVFAIMPICMCMIQQPLAGLVKRQKVLLSFLCSHL